MLAVALAIGLLTGACPMKVGIARDGALFSNVMQGWYRASPKSLAGRLRGGCYSDSHPSEITSVDLELAPNAPKERVDQVFLILDKAGWPRGKVKVGTWTNAPQAPR
jgi:hypothetical protein